MNGVWSGVITVATAIVGVAILAVLVSKNAQTPQVIGAAGKSFAGVLSAAVSPVTGGNTGASFFNTGFNSGIGVGESNYN